MAHIKNYIILFFFVAGYSSYAQTKNDSVFKNTTLSSFQLTDIITNKTVSLTPAQKKCIYIFLSPECPICQNYTSVLNKLNQEYGMNIGFYGIVPGKTYTQAEISSFAKKYKISYTLLSDQSLKFTRYLQAKVTPEVVFLNDNKLVYRGAIDNWFKGLGKARANTTENYLKDAIMQNLKHAKVDEKRTKAIGCLINDF
ncbi:MAG: redoxin domain-containing protein [Bacteroidetes bacterium]|nr:redoxin domain-containing protein [Bacteroidota bacterium]MBS1934341.1 redoxin domain-containing protein [Bacteroidota bacterium]